MYKREFIKGYHVNLILKGKDIKKIMIGNKEFYWEVPSYLKNKLKKGDLVIVNVENNYKSNGTQLNKTIVKSIVLIDEILYNFELKNKLNLKYVRNKYIGERAELIKHFIDKNMINQDFLEDSLAIKLAQKCNLSERSIKKLIEKYDEKKVIKAIEMFLATQDRKAPLKFINFILEKIS